MALASCCWESGTRPDTLPQPYSMEVMFHCRLQRLPHFFPFLQQAISCGTGSGIHHLPIAQEMSPVVVVRSFLSQYRYKAYCCHSSSTQEGHTGRAYFRTGDSQVVCCLPGSYRADRGCC